jgi:hypothetical protein
MPDVRQSAQTRWFAIVVAPAPRCRVAADPIRRAYVPVCLLPLRLCSPKVAVSTPFESVDSFFIYLFTKSFQLHYGLGYQESSLG